MQAMVNQEILRSTIASNVSRLRRERGLSQQKLADSVGISRAQVNRIEMGHVIPGVDVIFSVADVLGVPTDALRQLPVSENSFRTA